MTLLIDTNIAFHLRDGDRQTVQRIGAIDRPLFISIVSLIELEGGVVALPEHSRARRNALDRLLKDISVLDFDAAAAMCYRRIVENAGFSRPRILDRMIAATALAHALPVMTRNKRDFADIAGLELIAWEEGTPQETG